MKNEMLALFGRGQHSCRPVRLLMLTPNQTWTMEQSDTSHGRPGGCATPTTWHQGALQEEGEAACCFRWCSAASLLLFLSVTFLQTMHTFHGNNIPQWMWHTKQPECGTKSLSSVPGSDLKLLEYFKTPFFSFIHKFIVNTIGFFPHNFSPPNPSGICNMSNNRKECILNSNLMSVLSFSR